MSVVSIDRNITSLYDRMRCPCLQNKKTCKNNVKKCKPVCCLCSHCCVLLVQFGGENRSVGSSLRSFGSLAMIRSMVV